MIEGIKNIVELFLDKSKHWTLRAGVFISVIGVLFILDFTLDLSYNYYVSRKLENLEKIQILKKEYSADALFSWRNPVRSSGDSLYEPQPSPTPATQLSASESVAAEIAELSTPPPSV